MPSYWSQFPEFDHNPNAPIKVEFNRLAEMKDWDGKKDQKKAKYRKEWIKCFRSEFGKHYGSDDSSLEGWQSLCGEVGLDDIPETITKCKKALKGTVWVNIVDLVDCRRTGEIVKCYSSAASLRSYTRKTKKTFPKEAAKENGFLAALLITL